MPLSLDKKQSQRQKVDARDTYRYTTPDISPAARPTDPYVDPGKPIKQTGVSELLAALGDFGTAYERRQYQNEREALAQGEADFNTGQTPPENAHEARIRKYNELRGKAASFEFHKEAMDVYQKNQTDDPATLASKIEGVLKKYQIEKGGNDPNFMNGFAPAARQIISSIDTIHANKRLKDYEDEVMTNARTIINGVLDGMDPTDPQFGQNFRDQITDLQVNAKALGLTRTHISELAFEVLAGKAKLSGDHRYLAPLTVKDSSGQSVMDAVGADKFATLFNQTESIKHSRESMTRSVEADKRKENQNKVVNGLLTRFYQLKPDDINGHAQLQADINSYSTAAGNPDGVVLEPSQLDHLNVLVEGRKGKGGFATEQLPESMDLLRKSQLGQITPKELYDQRNKLTFEDYKLARSHLMQYELKLQNQQEKVADMRWKDGERRAVKLLVGDKGLYDRFAAPRDRELEEETRRWYQDEWASWIEQNPGKHPTPVDINGVIDRVQQRKLSDPNWKDHKPVVVGGESEPTDNSGSTSATGKSRIDAWRKREEERKQQKVKEDISKVQNLPPGAEQDEAKFNLAVNHVLNTEGGYSNNPADRGGVTNFGISSRANPDIDVTTLTPQGAIEIYRKRYWEPSGAAAIKDPAFALLHFDTAVNHGVGFAKKLLEESDGDPKKYLELRKAEYARIIAKDSSQKQFENGWANRVRRFVSLFG